MGQTLDEGWVDWNPDESLFEFFFCNASLLRVFRCRTMLKQPRV